MVDAGSEKEYIHRVLAFVTLEYVWHLVSKLKEMAIPTEILLDFIETNISVRNRL